MAMEIYVLSNRRLASIAEWQRAIDAEGLALRLSDDVSFGTMSGFLPVRMEGRRTGFECDHWEPEDVIGGYSEIDFDHAWKYVLAFRWIGDFDELQSVWMAAAAYATATDGVVFDPQEGKILTAAKARDAVREIERDRPIMEAAVRTALARLKEQRDRKP
jgi:hypothetical protein